MRGAAGGRARRRGRAAALRTDLGRHAQHLGHASRAGDQSTFEPDLGVSWLQPTTRFGTFRLDIHGTTRDGRAHLGRALLSLRDLEHRGVSYAVEAGDTFFSPNAGDYRFRNLFTPAINFSGLSAKASTARTDVAVMAGRATTTRNMFGTDVETLDQGLLVGRGSHEISERLSISSRASRIRTRDLKGFTFTVADSDQAGGGARFILTPAVHLAGNASVVWYRLRDVAATHTDGSALAGGSVLLARGWIQLNASQFSAGELPVLAQPLADRRTLYAAGEYDVFRRVRMFGGWEAFEANLDGHVIGRGPTDGSRAIGGIRVPLAPGSSASIRIEDGDRRTRLVGAAWARISDTGVLSGDVQSAFGAVSAFGRFARRENVESASGAGSYTQREASALAFVNVNRDLQLFSSLTALRKQHARRDRSHVPAVRRRSAVADRRARFVAPGRNPLQPQRRPPEPPYRASADVQRCAQRRHHSQHVAQLRPLCGSDAHERERGGQSVAGAVQPPFHADVRHRPGLDVAPVRVSRPARGNRIPRGIRVHGLERQRHAGSRRTAAGEHPHPPSEPRQDEHVP